MEPVLLLIHAVSLAILALVGLLGAYLTQPVFPLKEALKNWTEGLVAWALYWSLVFWQVTVPLTYGLWFNGKILGLPDVWATIVWALGVSFIAGLLIGIRHYRAYKAVSFWAFLGGLIVTFMFALAIDAIIYLLVGKFYTEMFSIGSWAYLSFNDASNVAGLILLVLYPVVAFIAARKMQVYLAVKRRILK